MASNAPADSSATGNVTIVEGSTTQTGSIQILTLGTGQTAETLTLPDGLRTVVYSNGFAKETNGTQATNPPLETVVTDQCADFPLPLFLSALGDREVAFRYIGAETLDGVGVQHIQVWDTFASKPKLQALAALSVRDIWLDSTSALPVKLAYKRHTGGGSLPAFAIEVSYSNYKIAAGVTYPFQINKSFNGTPWQTITIQDVSFNVGLTDSQFSVE